ncbi:MAG: cytochrome c [SAR324 cluster bacterium]|nr:cytochrome c [SAR324 cluster bacterium]
MKYKIVLSLFLFIVVFISSSMNSFAQRGGGGGKGGGGKKQQQSPASSYAGNIGRLAYIQKYGLPNYYENLTNPLVGSDSDFAQGRSLYNLHCANCHGLKGQGDGPSAQYYANVSDLGRTLALPYASEQYLYWVIAEGSGQFSGDMPRFLKSEDQARASSDLINSNQIWQVILYIQDFKKLPNRGYFDE